jgi:PEP-CTERM motif
VCRQPPLHLRRSLPALLVVSAALATPAWAVDFVNAQAFRNLDPVIVTDNNTGPSATAQKGFNLAALQGSAANTTRTRTDALAFGYGTPAFDHYDAISSTRSRYTLWDLASNTAVASAAGLGLTFNFSLTGLFEATVSRAYGPGPGGLQYATTGDATLLGGFAQVFSLQQTVGEIYGTLYMYSGSVASNDSRSGGVLSLDSIALTTGTGPLGGLGVRLNQTGQILPVVMPAVPEPATWAMWLVGLATAGFMRWRQKD